MKNILFFVLVTLSFISKAQNFNSEMKVTRAELEQMTYDKDSTASALVIYDYGNSYIDDESFKLIFKTKHKIKILKKDGLKNGELKIKLYKGRTAYEELKNVKATTYNLVNGKIETTQLSSTAIYEEVNDDFKLVKIVFPKVSVGSIITYSYETRSKFFRKFQPWYFQGDNPVLYSEYNTSIPGNYEYNIKLVGSKSLDVHDTSLKKDCIELSRGAGSDCAIAKYVMSNIPAYKPESFTTTALNYIARIEYELSVVRGFDGSVDRITKTWESVDKELKTDTDFGRQINKHNAVKNLLSEDIKSINVPLEKAESIYNYVLKNFKWNKKYERYDVSIKKALKEKIGNAFEINLLLNNLLNSEGFITYPILISTRANGFATRVYPVLTDFNYLIIKLVIEGETYYLDATDPYLSFGEIPFRCLNQYGRVIDFDNGSYWEDINIDNFSEQSHRITMSDFKDGLFNGKIESRFSGYHAHDVKRKFDENRNDYKETKKESYSNIDITQHDIIDYSKSNYYFNEDIEFNLEPEIIGDNIYLNPFIFQFFDENPFKLQERSYPIDFGYKDTYIYVIQMNFSYKYEVLEIPKGAIFSLPNKTGKVIFNLVKKDNTIQMYFRINFNEPVYGPEYYDSLKLFMNKVIETQKNTVIVLKQI